MKIALVTGGSRGIGKAICLRLAQAKTHHILINYHSNKTSALATLEEIQQMGASAEIIQFDVANHQDVTEKLQLWETQNPTAKVEIIVNNAGITKDGLFMWMPQEDWQNVIQTSLGGFYSVTQFFMQKLLSNRYGRIINIVSLSGLKGMPGQTNYSAAKAAIIGATKALAQEVAKRNITVNAVAPGFIATDMTADLDEKELVKLIPVNRFGKPEEVAELVAFLASENAAYITGEVININGGIYS